MPPTAQPASATGTRSRPLPPTIENAYHRKCIDLKRRINEVEASNDTARLRKSRIERSIAKLRLERAFLLEKLAERMDYNVDESDESSSPPPTPRDKPLRHKRTRKSSPPPAAAANSQGSPPAGNPYNIQTFSATPAPSTTPAHGQSRENNSEAPAVNGTPSGRAAASADSPDVMEQDDEKKATASAQESTISQLENGTTAESSGKAERSAAATENGQSQDVEMEEAGGAGFTAVNR